MSGRFSATNLLLGLAVAAILVFLAAPIAVPIVVSFSASPFLTFPPVGFSFEWYGKALGNPEFVGSLLLSFVLALIAMAGAVMLGTLAAWGLARSRFRGRAAIQGFLLSPLIFPLIVTGIALLQFFTLLVWQHALLRLAIAHIVITVPYAMRTVTASFQQLDTRLEEAARTLGATELEVFWKVTLPLITPGIAAGAIFAFVMSFDNFPVSMWLYDAEYMPVPLRLFSLIDRFLDPSIAAASTILILLSVILILTVERLMGLRRFVNP